MPLAPGEAAFAHVMSNLSRVGKIQNKLNALISLLNSSQLLAYHQYLYYSGAPEISDKEYDKLKTAT